MDNTIFFFFYNFAQQSILGDNIFMFFAVYFPFIVVILAGLFLLFHHEILQAENPFRVFLQKKKEILIVFFSAFSSYFISTILKILFHTLRPFILFPVCPESVLPTPCSIAPYHVYPLFGESGYAFPSSHAAFFFALAFSIFFMHKKAGYIFLFFALLIGLARIIAGVHFPIDIFGGFTLGALVAYLFAYFAKKIYPHT